MADVFISYSKAQATEAARLARELANFGYEVWWDTSLLPTGSFGVAIDRELDAAKAVVVLWSPEAARSKWVRSEASHADRQDKLVNCHTAEITIPAVQIPKPFEQTHSVPADNIPALVRALDALSVPRSDKSAASMRPAALEATAAEMDDRLFAEVAAAGTAEAYQFYLDELPQGRSAAIARFRLRGLMAAQTSDKPAYPSTRLRGVGWSEGQPESQPDEPIRAEGESGAKSDNEARSKEVKIRELMQSVQPLALIMGTGRSIFAYSVKDLRISSPSDQVLVSAGTVTLLSKLEGAILCERLQVDEQATLVGLAAATEIVCAGHVVGDLRARRIQLNCEAQVEGDIYAEQLSIQQGAYFEGKFRRIRSDDEVLKVTATIVKQAGL